jgi:hypothetical protein
MVSISGGDILVPDRAAYFVAATNPISHTAMTAANTPKTFAAKQKRTYASIALGHTCHHKGSGTMVSKQKKQARPRIPMTTQEQRLVDLTIQQQI